MIVRQLADADLLVTTADFDGAHIEPAQRVNLGEIVLRAGRPVLLIPPETQDMNIDTVMIAWKDARETRRAIADALPFLKLAKQVMIVGLAAARDLPEAEKQLTDLIRGLARHGISAQRRVECFYGVQSNQLEAIAQEIGADLMVAGAYSHTPVREWVIGGVTIDLLLHPKRPTLISH